MSARGSPRTTERPHVDRRAISLFVGMFAVGVLVGIVELLTDRDQTSTRADVAIANWVHVGIAVILVVVLVAAYGQDRRRLAALLARPFTAEGWVAVRKGFTDLPLLLVGRRPFGGAVPAIAAFILTVLIVLMPVRAGEQVFAGLDPDFTRDAWGGPGYVGASLAHWMDGLLLFYALFAGLRRVTSSSVRA